jgi:SAM-dependent methyltransferase
MAGRKRRTYKTDKADLRCMLLQKTLGLKEDVFLLESGFEGLEMNLKTLDYLDKLGMLPERSIESVVDVTDRGGNSIAAAIKNRYEESYFWFVIPYPSAKAARMQTEKLVKGLQSEGIAVAVKKKKVDAATFKEGLREYFAVSLAERALCDCDKDMEPISFALNEGRNRRIRALLKKLSSDRGFKPGDMEVLEICCGNGMSTAAIKPLFKHVLSVDNDKCAVCNGIYNGILEPADVMVADAMQLTRYVDEKYDAILGFMLGTIYDFNKNIWRMIFEESLKTLKDDGFVLFTVNKKEEMDFLAGAFTSMGIEGKVVDNRNDKDIYDGWAFFAVKKDGKFLD